jgi:hypothetical protein
VRVSNVSEFETFPARFVGNSREKSLRYFKNFPTVSAGFLTVLCKIKTNDCDLVCRDCDLLYRDCDLLYRDCDLLCRDCDLLYRKMNTLFLNDGIPTFVVWDRGSLVESL